MWGEATVYNASILPSMRTEVVIINQLFTFKNNTESYTHGVAIYYIRVYLV
jgi:hypothetical protein